MASMHTKCSPVPLKSDTACMLSCLVFCVNAISCLSEYASTDAHLNMTCVINLHCYFFVKILHWYLRLRFSLLHFLHSFMLIVSLFCCNILPTYKCIPTHAHLNMIGYHCVLVFMLKDFLPSLHSWLIYVDCVFIVFMSIIYIYFSLYEPNY